MITIPISSTGNFSRISIGLPIRSRQTRRGYSRRRRTRIRQVPMARTRTLPTTRLVNTTPRQTRSSSVGPTILAPCNICMLLRSILVTLLASAPTPTCWTTPCTSSTIRSSRNWAARPSWRTNPTKGPKAVPSGTNCCSNWTDKHWRSSTIVRMSNRT